jgi:alpha-amylase/alpha-mannosidase (GH57 family)
MVPSLLEQIIDYAEGKAVDPHLELSQKNAADLNDDDKTRMTDLLFQANYDNLIAPFKKYKSLYLSRGKAAENWSEEDWRDLQCLANLAWIDPSFRKKGKLKELTAKGERYTEEDKSDILKAQKEIISKIIPTLKDYMREGQIEISVTPFFHPIMPLIYDTDSALVATPNSRMPEMKFRHPEDVDRQVEMAVNFYKELFGRAPSGMWPY